MNWHKTAENYILSRFTIWTAHQVLLGWPDQEDKMGGECGTYGMGGGKEKRVQFSGRKTWR